MPPVSSRPSEHRLLAVATLALMFAIATMVVGAYAIGAVVFAWLTGRIPNAGLLLVAACYFLAAVCVAGLVFDDCRHPRRVEGTMRDQCRESWLTGDDAA